MKTLIIKLGATGDVVRTTTLLHELEGEVHWLTSDLNTIMLAKAPKVERIIAWSKRKILKGDSFDLVINLEDSMEAAILQRTIQFKMLFGAYMDENDQMVYTDSSREWFDLSLISRFGIQEADRLKLKNRKTFQEMVFRGLGFTFSGQPYFQPKPVKTDLLGDIAIAPKSGTVWPMKNWAFFDKLKQKLETDGFAVNYLPMRDTLGEHLGDVKNHNYLISGDSLPMHIAMGYGIRCLSIFICTSPWEIYDYGLQTKIVSPLIGKFFYKRDFKPEAVTSLSLNEVYDAVLSGYSS